MAQEEFIDYGRTSWANVRKYLEDEFDLTPPESYRIIVRHSLTFAAGLRAGDKAVDTGDRIMEKEPAL